MHLLPQHIIHEFFNNPSKRLELIDIFDEVTILFADIAGFTAYSSNREPEEVVLMLRNLFTDFDKCCLIHNVYKLYTIGDCYVILGLINANSRNPEQEAKNVVEMGFSMIEIIKEVRKAIQFEELDMRIGIHSGRVIGGVIGTDIVRYDVYGSDVVIANKMESNGEKGKIQVSEETKDLLLKLED